MKTSKKLPIDRHFDCMNSCWCRSDLCGEICLERDYPRLKAQVEELRGALERIADSETSNCQVEYMKGIARAALAKVSQ